MTLLKNWKYHVFTIIYLLSTIFFLLTLRKLVYTEIYKVNPNSVYIAEWLIVSLFLYIISNLIVIFTEWLSRKNISHLKNIIIIGAFVLFLHVIFQIVLWPTLLYFNGLIMNIDFSKMNIKNEILEKRFVNYCYFLFITINWLVFIYAYKIYQSKQDELKQKLDIEKNLKEANLNTLKGQINPHFIFNSLNNIRGLVQENPAKSKEMITRISELLRSSLLSGKTNFVKLEQELETVENFLEISKIQYENRLHFHLDISSETKNIQIPPMIVQMLVENAVKHGISILKDGGEINIKTFLNNNNFHMIVKNTGSISQHESSTKIGLKNIEERLKLLYNDKASFKLSEENNEVTAEIIISNDNIPT